MRRKREILDELKLPAIGVAAGATLSAGADTIANQPIDRRSVIGFGLAGGILLGSLRLLGKLGLNPSGSSEFRNKHLMKPPGK